MWIATGNWSSGPWVNRQGIGAYVAEGAGPRRHRCCRHQCSLPDGTAAHAAAQRRLVPGPPRLNHKPQ